MRDRDGVLWIGGAAGVTRHDGNVWSTLSALDGVGGNEAWLNLQDKDGAIWIGTENGLTRYLPDRRDLNRSFPGSSQGPLASRLAHLFMKEVVRYNKINSGEQIKLIPRGGGTNVTRCLVVERSSENQKKQDF